MNRSLESCIPKWAVKRICRKQCNCGYNYKQKDIVQIGIRKIKRDDKEQEALGWYNSSLVIFFTDGSYLFPSQDDEGNGAGALFTSFKELPTIPVI